MRQWGHVWVPALHTGTPSSKSDSRASCRRGSASRGPFLLFDLPQLRSPGCFSKQDERYLVCSGGLSTGLEVGRARNHFKIVV